MARERDRNRFEQACADCGITVPADEGRLYRLSGAALSGRFNRAKRSRFTGKAYIVRCEPCYRKNDRLSEPTEDDSAAHSSPGYSEACGVWN